MPQLDNLETSFLEQGYTKGHDSLPIPTQRGRTKPWPRPNQDNHASSLFERAKSAEAPQVQFFKQQRAMVIAAPATAQQQQQQQEQAIRSGGGGAGGVGGGRPTTSSAGRSSAAAAIVRAAAIGKIGGGGVDPAEVRRLNRNIKDLESHSRTKTLSAAPEEAQGPGDQLQESKCGGDTGAVKGRERDCPPQDPPSYHTIVSERDFAVVGEQHMEPP